MATKNCLTEAVLMRTHNIVFMQQKSSNFCIYPKYLDSHTGANSGDQFKLLNP